MKQKTQLKALIFRTSNEYGNALKDRNNTLAKAKKTQLRKLKVKLHLT